MALLILGRNPKNGSLTLPQSPVPEDATTKLFSEPISSSHTAAWPHVSVSPGYPCCCSFPGLPLSLYVLHGLSLSVSLDREACSGNMCCHPGCSSPPGWDQLAQSSMADPFPGTTILSTTGQCLVCLSALP